MGEDYINSLQQGHSTVIAVPCAKLKFNAITQKRDRVMKVLYLCYSVATKVITMATLVKISVDF